VTRAGTWSLLLLIAALASPMAAAPETPSAASAAPFAATSRAPAVPAAQLASAPSATPTAGTSPTPAAAATPQAHPPDAALRSDAARRPNARRPEAARRPSTAGGPRTLDEVHIEGEIPVPQVLFVTARDQRRFVDFQHRRFLRTSLQIARDTALPRWIGVTGNPPAPAVDAPAAEASAP
jgi:hypothetical protein